MTPQIDTLTPTVSRSIESPLGRLTLLADARDLVGVYFEQHRPAPRTSADHVGTNAVLDGAAHELDAYFRSSAYRFGVRIAARGTDLERAVWRELEKIPLGETTTYGAIARAIGRPGAARAVGSAVARNPLSIVVPCHRVVGANGSLTGFAGGLPRKRWLLAHEGAVHA